jgi:hypothetical protein
MGEMHSSGGQMHPLLRKVLLFALLTGGIPVFVSMLWLFQRIDSSLGHDLAEVAVALISILVMALVVIGMRVGLSVDRYVRRHRLEKFRIYQSSHPVRHLCSLLGYGEPPRATKPEPDGAELLALIERPKHRGRPPTYGIDRWKKVVLAWENRDPLRNSLTLAEFLAEQFGVYADGSPRMSENSYYDWRKKVVEEVRKDTGGMQLRT